MRLLLFIIIALNTISSVSYSNHNMVLGAKFSNFINLHGENVENIQVALPKGVWVITSKETKAAQRSNQGSSLTSSGTVFEQVYLANIVNGKLKATMRIRYTAKSHSTGFSVPKFCQADYHNYLNVPYAYDGTETDCLAVSYIPGVSRPGSAGARTIEAINKMGAKMPSVLIFSNFALMKYDKYLNVGYAFNPEFDGIAKPENMGRRQDIDYYVTKIGNYPEKKAYMEKIISWAKEFRIKFKAGFNGKLQSKVSSQSNEQVEDTKNTSPDSLKQKLFKLKKLLDAGLITKEEAAEKRKAILDSL